MPTSAEWHCSSVPYRRLNSIRLSPFWNWTGLRAITISSLRQRTTYQQFAADRRRYRGNQDDVYAEFLTGTKTGGITPAPTTFPTTPQQLSQVVAYAQAHGTTFSDANALAIELKTSWVEA